MITREQLYEQRAVYEKQKNDALNLANANQGAMEAIDWVLSQMDAREGQSMGEVTPPPEVRQDGSKT